MKFVDGAGGLAARRTTVLILTLELLVGTMLPTLRAEENTMPTDTKVDLFRPDFFPILPWDPLHGWSEPYVEPANGLESIADCHFTLAGFVWPEDLALCEKLGLAAILFPQCEDVGRWCRQWPDLSDEEIAQRVRNLVQAGGDSQALAGYFLTDEPGALSFPALGKAVAAVKKYAPGKLAYINLYPGYATIGASDKSQLQAASFTEYLERYVQEVKPQFLSYDNYMVQYSQDLQDTKRAASYFRDLLEVRRVAQKYGLPFWHIVSSNQIRPFTTIPSPANLHFQAYTTLAAGGRGLSWYTYYHRGYGYAPIGPDGRKTLTWRYVQMVNHQVKVLGPIMNRLHSTGVYFTNPAPVESLPLLPGELVTEVECAEPLMVGEFRHEEGTRYVMLVNLSLQNSAKAVPKKEGVALEGEVISAEDGRPVPIDYERGLWLVAGQGALIKLPISAPGP